VSEGRCPDRAAASGAPRRATHTTSATRAVDLAHLLRGRRITRLRFEARFNTQLSRNVHVRPQHVMVGPGDPGALRQGPHSPGSRRHYVDADR
jgi:hypothetical protein